MKLCLRIGLLVVCGLDSLARPHPAVSGAMVDVGAETATHVEGEALPVSFSRLTSVCLRADGCLLACDGGEKAIKVISPQGVVTSAIPLDVIPYALDIGANGTLYCGGQGRIAKLTADGMVLRSVEPPANNESPEGQRRRRAPRVSVMDYKRTIIRVLDRKGP